VWHKKELFVEEKPKSVVVSIFPTHGSDICQNRKKIEGIQKILKIYIDGLKDENIVITDQSGLVLNDFEGVTE
jgi:flagellar M-ring protein FliF